MVTTKKSVAALACVLSLVCVSYICGDEDSDTAQQVVVKAEYVDGYFISRRLASVRIYQDAGRFIMLGSGTIVGIGEYGDATVGIGVSADHIISKNAETFHVQTIDGKNVGARVIDRDESEDLLIFVIDAKSVVGVAPISDELKTNDAYAIGFPDGIGPNEKRVTYKYRHIVNDKYVRDRWYVHSGHHSDGDSGGGIFSSDQLVGVLTHGPTHREPNQSGTALTVQAVPCGKIRDRLRLNRGKIRQCQNGQCEPEGPRDLNWLRPNVDIGIPGKPNRPIEQIENPKRPDILGPFEQRKAIAELQFQVRELTARIEKLEQSATEPTPVPVEEDAPPPPTVEGGITEAQVKAIVSAAISDIKAPKGEKGDRGEKGDPAPEREIEIILKWDNGEIISRGKVPPGSNRAIQVFRRQTVERNAVTKN